MTGAAEIFPSFAEAHDVALDQCAFWRAREISIALACLSIDRLPVDGWDAMACLVAAEWRKAGSIIASGELIAA